MIVNGDVKEVNRLDIDKSGRNPKYLLIITLELGQIERNIKDFELQSTMVFQGKEQEILQQIKRIPQVGEMLTIESCIDNEIGLVTFPIKRIQFRAREESDLNSF